MDKEVPRKIPRFEVVPCLEVTEGGRKWGIEKQQHLEMGSNAASGTDAKQRLAHPSLLDPADNERFLRDQYQLCCLLPDEIWLMILTKIKNTENIQNVKNASLYLRSLLHPIQTEQLFPLVFPVLGRYLEREVSETTTKTEQLSQAAVIDSDDEVTDDDADNTNDHLRVCSACRKGKLCSRQHCKEVVKLRLACKTWCGAVDSFYQWYSDSFVDIEDPKKELNLSTHWQYYQFPSGNGNVQAKFLRHFENTGNGKERSPFITNTVSFFLNRDEPGDEASFMNLNWEILHKYGKYIKYFKIVESEHCDPLETYTRLFNMMHLMPNLEHLEVSLSNCFQAVYSQDVSLQLAEKIESFPLSKLSKLESLVLFHAYSEIFSELVRSNDHIAKLFLINCGKDYCDSGSYSSRSLSSLTELILHLQHCSQLDFFLNSRFNGPLVKLRVSFQFANMLNFTQFFASMHEMCGESLEELILVLLPQPLNRLRVDPSAAQVSFKKLRSFRLMTSCVYSLDFLLVMKDSLEYLDVILITEGLSKDNMTEHPEYVDQDKRVKFFDCVENPLQSNIWNVLPHLKRVRYFESEDITEDPVKVFDICRWDWKMSIGASFSTGDSW